MSNEKPHMTITTDQEVIDAIQRNGTTDPRGECIDGVWWVEVDSIPHWREQREKRQHAGGSEGL